MPAELDRCVEKVMAQGKDKSSAFAICRTALKMSEQEADVKESKVDEDGDIIIAENVPITISAGISVIKE